jgi:hypothetical protein
MYRTLDAVLAAGGAGRPGWNQQKWVDINTCGTAFCYAGWALHLTGWQAVRLKDEGTPDHLSEVMVKDGRILRWMEIGAAARDLLGLTNEEADALFAEENTIEDLKELVDSIVSGTFEWPEGAEPWVCEFPEVPF